jgi:hypothetical protein
MLKAGSKMHFCFRLFFYAFCLTAYCPLPIAFKTKAPDLLSEAFVSNALSMH